MSRLPPELDPRLRKCQRCGLTWETPEMMRQLGGVCHDCHFEIVEYNDRVIREAAGE